LIFRIPSDETARSLWTIESLAAGSFRFIGQVYRFQPDKKSGSGAHQEGVQRTPYSQSAAPVLSCSTCPMPKTVLVADDNPTIRKMLCRMFEKEEHYDLCAEAEDGKQAIELALQHRPDLIILDLSMPVMNGLEAAHELKKLMPKVPIILFT
jgi:PleD family two-component response regulator